jgi:phage gpG-like protein
VRFALSASGHHELTRQLYSIIEAADASLAEVLNFAAQSTAQRAKTAIRTGTRTGHVYEVDGRTHQASAPGEAPANLSGTLANSITHTRITGRPESGAEAGTNLHYGPALEFGGYTDFDGVRVWIEPRPYLMPAFEAAVYAARNRFAPSFASHVRGVL